MKHGGDMDSGALGSGDEFPQPLRSDELLAHSRQAAVDNSPSRCSDASVAAGTNSMDKYIKECNQPMTHCCFDLPSPAGLKCR